MHHSVFLLSNEKNRCHPLERHQTLIRNLSSFGEFLTYENNAEWLPCYAKDSQHLKSLLPLLVFRPHDVFSLRPFVRACYEEGVPIQTRGGGTSLSGASVVSPEGILVLTNHLNTILDYDSAKGIIKIEPGVTCNQLNHYVQDDGWEFPLEMAASGVASLGGCLSCQAQGYHQGSRHLYKAVASALLIDGTGELCEVPGSLLCGAEGMFGIIIRLDIELSCIPEKRMILQGELAWEEIIQHLDFFKQCQSLQSLCCQIDRGVYQCQLTLEGDTWRLKAVSNQIKELFFPKIIECAKKKILNLSMKNHPSIVLNCTLPISHLADVKNHLHDLANSLGIEIEFCMEVLSGTLYLLLHSPQSLFEFGTALDHFMVRGIEWIEKFNGRLFGSQGVGKVWQPYMPPFFGEEDLNFLRNFKKGFDPKGLFCRDHFFPEEGKCLVRSKALSKR